ncbi:hypothetical protein DU500_13170 [Haloplanus rubicundus]|uniref:DUF7993 domain-containing protein n=1 Tax=Haloplanus rubicundus TaxID=1547898 RepID=A0A345E526_9EURY|nr:hypothetical protein [Haloplanus rubicundus]AXG07298.1 hypothetical protein DU500_13170 [Haloplanus rubicundus]AXG10699.1 hypothetical protein DU484_13070 [Haloplanus rubicundus]
MVSHELDDGVRIAQLLASDLVGHEDGLADVTVTDADPDVEPTPNGARAYRVRAADRPLAVVFVHPERARIVFEAGPEATLDAARDAGLRVRPKATEPPRTVVFVENGAEVKRVLRVVEAAVSA